MIGIYTIRNVSNGKVYVGSSKKMSKRWAEHRRALDKGIHHSLKLQRAWSRYGSEVFVFEVVEVVNNPGDLLCREQDWIDRFTSSGPSGYNVCGKAGSTIGRVCSAEARAKMSARKVGTKRSLAAREKQSKAMLGVRKSDEHKRNISAGQKGKSIPDATRRAVSAANSRRVHSESTREKLSLASKRAGAIARSKARLNDQILAEMNAKCEFDRHGKLASGVVAAFAAQHQMSKSRISVLLKRFRSEHDIAIPERKQIDVSRAVVDADTGEILEAA